MSKNFDELRPGKEGPNGLGVPGVRRGAYPSQWNWEELNSSYRPRLIAAGIVRFQLTREECEDAAQTVFLKILTQNPRVRDPKAYLRAAFLHQAQNVAEMKLRRREREAALEDWREIGVDEFGNAERQAEKIRMVTAVTGAFRRVGDKCQKVIRSYCIDECTLNETAEKSGFSSKTVWKRVQECLKRMRVCLES